MKPLFSEPFFIGVNYWASHAGTNMWQVWDEEVIAEDFRRLRDNHIQVLRMFPLWPDFQPLTLLYGGQGQPVELRWGETPLPDTPEGRAGVNPVMLERFDRFCELAERYGLRLIVGLLTGWMSGRLYVPRAFEGRNVLTDPLCITWELKFVRLMVSRFKDSPTIAGWDLGNECNCMGRLESPEQADLWTAAVSDAIRAADPEGTSTGLRPIVSGLHGLCPEGIWRPESHGDLVDVLTTHPYPIFTPYCDTDELGGFKASLHAAGQTSWYRGLGKRPAFAEEVGTLGPMLCDEATAAGYVNTALYQLYAHDCRGFCWWCAAEQSHLTHAPYDWCSVERELGLFRLDGTPKPVTLTMKKFAEDIAAMPPLPPRIVDAVCVTTAGNDSWAAAFGAVLCAKLAGLDVEFTDGARPLPRARCYILPSLAGQQSMSRRRWYELFDRVQSGATLLMTLDTALLSPFTEVTGLRVHTRARAVGSIGVSFPGTRNQISLRAPFRLTVTPTTAKILAAESDGNPIMTVNRYGKGLVYTVTVPVEKTAATEPHIVADQPLLPRFYELAGLRSPERAAEKQDAMLCLTEHVASEKRHLLVLINPNSEARRAVIRVKEGWRFERTLSPTGPEVRVSSGGFAVTLAADTGLVVSLTR